MVEGHEAVSDRGARLRRGVELGVERHHRFLQHVDPRHAVARVGAPHRSGDVEHHHHVGAGEVDLGLAFHPDRHARETEDLHDRGRDIDRRQAGNGVVFLQRHHERAALGAIGPVAEIDVEETLPGIGHVFGDFPRRRGLGAEALARGEHAGIAGLLQPALREVGTAHVDPAADHGEDRRQRRGDDRQRVARPVAGQPRQAKGTRAFRDDMVYHGFAIGPFA